MENVVLVLGGGGMKGAYQIGVWKGLKELNINYNTIIGTSIGALNAAMMLQNDFDSALDLWNKMEYDMVFSDPSHKHMVNVGNRAQMMGMALREGLWKGGFDVTPFKTLLESKIDEQKIRDNKLDFGLVMTKVIHHKDGLLGRVPKFEKIEVMKQDIPKEMLVDYLMASSACYPIFKPQMIDEDIYLDGGYTDDLPINFANSLNPTEIIAVDLESIGVKHKNKEITAKIRYIKSRWNLGELFNFDKNRVRRNIAMGYLDILKEYGKYEGNSYTFNLGEIKKLISDYALYSESNNANDDNAKVHKSFLGDLQKRVKIPIIKETTVVDMMEAAGRILKIPPDKVYTIDMFNSHILYRYNSLLNEREQNENEGIISSLKQFMKASKSRLFLAAMLKNLNVDEFDTSTYENIPLLPDSVLAGFYIIFLMNK